jgi:predicted ATP-binding protein involved in virulence
MTSQSKAIRALKQHAKKGSIAAMFELYDYYSKGQDIAVDDNMANDYFTQCLAFLTAQTQLGDINKPVNKVALTKLKLINFRKFKSLDIEFDKSLTVFIGSNGAGKTTIADAITKTFSWINARIETNGKAGRPLVEFDINIDSQHYAEVSSTIILGVSDSYESALARTIKGAESEKRSDLEGFRDFSNLYRVINDKQRNVGNPEINIPLLACYSVDRSNTNAKQSFVLEKLSDHTLTSRFDALNSSALGGSGDFEQFLEWFVVLNNLINATADKSEDLALEIKALEAVATDSTHPLWQLLVEKQTKYVNRKHKQAPDKKKQWLTLHKTVKAAVIKMVPSVCDLFVDLGSGRAQVKVINDGNTINVLQTSKGQQILISLVGDLARRLVLLNPVLTNPLQGQGIVLIDEIELHLHPQWQQDVISSLQATFPNIQFIITTHSPQVLSTVDKACIRQLSDDEDGETIVEVPAFQTKGVASAEIMARIMGTDSIPAIAESQWANEFSALLQEDKKEEALKILPTFRTSNRNIN